MYRAATLAAIGLTEESAVIATVRRTRIELAPRLGRPAGILLDGQDVGGRLREPEIDRGVSFVSAIPEVRERLVAEQRRFAEIGDVVLVGSETSGRWCCRALTSRFT